MGWVGKAGSLAPAVLTPVLESALPGNSSILPCCAGEKNGEILVKFTDGNSFETDSIENWQDWSVHSLLHPGKWIAVEALELSFCSLKGAASHQFMLSLDLEV